MVARNSRGRCFWFASVAGGLDPLSSHEVIVRRLLARVGLDHGLHACGHVIVALGLFGELGLLDLFLLVRHNCLCCCGILVIAE